MENDWSELFKGAEYLGKFEDDSPEWHEIRSQGIGGSEIGTIMGLNPWESAYALWAKKSGKIENTFTGNTATRLGKLLEEPILQMFQENHPNLTLHRPGTFRMRNLSILHANVDALAYDPETGEWAVVEVKTARYQWDSIPEHYVAQVQHYMDVLGLKKAYIVALCGMEPFEALVEADEFQQSVQRDRAIQFWYGLQDGKAPEWDGSESTYQVVRQMHPLIEDREEEIGELGIGLWNAQLRFDEAQKELNSYKSAVMDAMGYAKHATVTVDGEPTIQVASRQIRGGYPALIINRKGK